MYLGPVSDFLFPRITSGEILNIEELMQYLHLYSKKLNMYIKELKTMKESGERDAFILEKSTTEPETWRPLN